MFLKDFFQWIYYLNCGYRLRYTNMWHSQSQKSTYTMWIYNILENTKVPFLTLYCMFINVLLWATSVWYYHSLKIFLGFVITQFNIFTTFSIYCFLNIMRICSCIHTFMTAYIFISTNSAITNSSISPLCKFVDIVFHF